jgi:hypothetical protein
MARWRLNDLGQHTAGGAGVQERHARPPDPDPRTLIDQAHAGGGQLSECLLDILDTVGDVMQTNAARGEEAADGGVRPERRQQLDMPVADVEQRGLHALIAERLAMHERQLQNAGVERDGGVDVLDANADVVDRRQHRAGAYPPLTRQSVHAGCESGQVLDYDPARRYDGASPC